MKKYICLAMIESLKSKDPNTKVGAVLVKNDEILSYGHNGFFKEYEDNFSWNDKYPYVIHAEMDCITKAINDNKDIKDSVLYVTHYPCNECAKLIVLSKIKKIYYMYDKYPDSKETIASKNIFKKLNINIEKYK